MIFVTLPMMIVALFPIIVAETVLMLMSLKLPLGRLLAWTAGANAVSALIGIPATWFLLVTFQIATGGGRGHGVKTLAGRLLAVTWQAPWLVPHEEELVWMVPVATLVLLVPFFFSSWWIEYSILKRAFRATDKRAVSRAVRNANFVSYSVLAVYVALTA